MSRGTWNRIKFSKLFYVHNYRQVLTWLLTSVLLNGILCSVIIYSYFHLPDRHFYASNGITSPVELIARDEPNNSAEALLPPDPVNEDDDKVIPE